MSKWIQGIPSADAVVAHETDHPRADGIHIGEIMVAHGDGTFRIDRIKTNERMYGEWLCYHKVTRFEPYSSIMRLKAVDGTVYMALGFTQWEALNKCFWASGCIYMPVSNEGLPLDYKVE